MAYIGRQNQSGTFIKLDNIESQFNGQLVTFNLTLSGDPFFTSNPYSLLVSLDGVIQEPVASYIIVENQITFAAAPPVGTNFYCVVLATTQTTPALTSLTIGRRSGAYNIDLHGAGFTILARDGTKKQVPFNVA